MQITIVGLIVDKWEHTSIDKKTNQKVSTLKCLVYQKETHQTTTVTISLTTYQKLEVLKQGEILCQIGAFAGSNGQVIQYFKELSA